jgi:CDP-glucose 4,6-dehydratase
MDAAFLEKAFAGRSVFLTGHTGFKGSWMAMWLHRLGALVSGFSLAPPTRPSNFEASGVQQLLLRHYEADIRDYSALSQAIEESSPDVVFHLAAQPLVRESYVTPRETMEANFMGTCNVLECIRRRERPCAVVVITSDKCYENREQLWGYREDEAMGGHDPYSASKGAAEILTASYRRSFFSPEKIAQHGVKLATVRAGNVIGGGDWANDRIVPDIVRALVRREAVSVRNPRAVRPWQHVLEPLSGYLTVAAKMLESDDPAICSAWNFGPALEGTGTVQDLVEAFCEAWGDGQWKDTSDPTQVHEANLLRLSIEKATARLHWQPTWSFRETIARTAQWYRNYYESHECDCYRACLRDILAFEGCAAMNEPGKSLHTVEYKSKAA